MKKYTILLFCLFLFSARSNAEFVVERDSPIVVGEKLSENIGIETLGGVLTPILVAGCAIPCEVSQIFSTAEDNQDQITITLVRGLSKMAKSGVNLGRYKIIGIPPAPRGIPQIKVVFGASNGRIWLSASDAEGKSNVQIVKQE